MTWTSEIVQDLPGLPKLGVAWLEQDGETQASRNREEQTGQGRAGGIGVECAITTHLTIKQNRAERTHRATRGKGRPKLPIDPSGCEASFFLFRRRQRSQARLTPGLGKGLEAAGVWRVEIKLLLSLGRNTAGSCSVDRQTNGRRGGRGFTPN